MGVWCPTIIAISNKAQDCHGRELGSLDHRNKYEIEKRNLGKEAPKNDNLVVTSQTSLPHTVFLTLKRA